ncbi:MAG TPA: PilZ domain-containing protein, partial [Thermoanaerobaculia bacterium]|nr:PilZ domain-containing protein [Thermoanaerobaculia bacterium]
MSRYRRHHPRIADPGVSLVMPGDREAIAAQVCDLSAGGARVQIGGTLPVGAELEVELDDLEASSEETLRLRARVVRLTAPGTSPELVLEFVDRLAGSAMRLLALVERQGGTTPEPAATASANETPAGSAPAGSAAAASRGSSGSSPARGGQTGGELGLAEPGSRERAAAEAPGDRESPFSEVATLRASLADERERRTTAERALAALQAELAQLRAEVAATAGTPQVSAPAAPAGEETLQALPAG